MAQASGARARNLRISSAYTLVAVLCSASVRRLDVGGFEWVLLAIAIALWLVGIVYFVRGVRSPKE